MSSNARTTLSARVSSLENDVATVKADVRLILNALTGTPVEAPKAKAKKAKATKVEATKVEAKPTVTRKPKARNTPNRKPVVNGTVEGARCLTRHNRAQFIADHSWAKDLPPAQRSTSALARLVIEGGMPLVGSWAIGPRRAETITGKAQPVTGPAVKAGKKAKKGKKGKTVVQAVVEVAAPAKALTPAQQARVEAPRDALGRVTPKVEWPLREALAESGKYDRHEIDAKVAAAHEAGVFA